MGRWTASLHPRDARGRFTSSGRRSKKIKKLQSKNSRVIKQYRQDKSLHGTPMGASIERSIISRSVKIDNLKAKQVRR